MTGRAFQFDPALAGPAVEQLRTAALNAATEDEARAVTAEIRAFLLKVRLSRWEPYPWQHPHLHTEGWVSTRAPGKGVCDERCVFLPPATIGVHEVWKQRGGRGTGKTEGAAHEVNKHATGPACDHRVPGGHRFTIVAPTQADAVSSCVEGVSGLKAVNPGITITTNREGTTVRWPNGSVGRLLGAHTPKDVDRARAWSNVCMWWLEEAAAMVHLGGLGEKNPSGQLGMLDQAPFTLRLGPRPHMIATTTPRNRPEVVALLDMPGPETWGRTEDAARLDPAVREALEVRFRGTTTGFQELDGELIADTPGALWVSHRPDDVDGEPNKDHRPGIENDRVPIGAVGWTQHPRPEALGGDGREVPPVSAPLMVHRTVLAIDPAGGRTENGMVVVGTLGQHAYILADLTLAGPPDTWAKVALEAYYDYGCEGLAAEHTYGGDQVKSVIDLRAETLGINPPPVFRVPTKVGKRLRAEPVQALYQQHRIHHVGFLDGLETEQRTWVPDHTTESPNRIDALVHGVTYLLIRNGTGQISNPARSQVRIPSTFSR